MAIKLDAINNGIIFLAGSTHETTIKSSPLVPLAWTLTLPLNPGVAGEALITDGNGVTSWGPAGGATVENDTTSLADYFPLFSRVTSGVVDTVYTSDAKYLYNPEKGQLTSPVVAASNGIFLNAQDIFTSYLFPNLYNGLSAGPITVHPGAIVTVPPTSNWRVI